MTPEQIVRLCREHWAGEGLSTKSIEGYAAVLLRACRLFEKMGTSLESATATEVRELSANWPMTRSSRMQLRTVLARAWEVLDRPEPPKNAVRVPPKPRYRCRALDEPSARALAAAARDDETREGLAVLLGLYAGLRRSEIASLRWDNISGEWLGVTGKRSVYAEISIHPRLADRLAKWRAEVPFGPRQAPFVFPGRFGGHVSPAAVAVWVQRLSRKALGVECTPHVLRHTAIAEVNDRTGDLRVAQEFARHASPETTVIYTRVSARRLMSGVGAIDY